jgi:hypothetical protein
MFSFELYCYLAGCQTLWSIATGAEHEPSDTSLQIPQFLRTPELRFRALLTESAAWRVEVVGAR